MDDFIVLPWRINFVQPGQRPPWEPVARESIRQDFYHRYSQELSGRVLTSPVYRLLDSEIRRRSISYSAERAIAAQQDAASKIFGQEPWRRQ